MVRKKGQPKYKKDQRVRIILGKNKTNPAYKYLIKHDSQHGIIVDLAYIPASGKNVDFSGVYLYKMRIGTSIVSDIPEQALMDVEDSSSTPIRRGYQ